MSLESKQSSLESKHDRIHQYQNRLRYSQEIKLFLKTPHDSVHQFQNLKLFEYVLMLTNMVSMIMNFV